MKDHNTAFGRALREVRREYGHTQETLAFACELDRTYISLLELGTCSPTLDTIIAVCDGLGVPFAQLAYRVDVERSSTKSR